MLIKKRNVLWLMLLFVFVLPAFVHANGITGDMWGEIKAWDHSTQSVERMPWVYGNKLYYAKDYNIHSSIFDNGVWSEPQPVPGPINTGANEINPCVVGGGKVLYFARHDPFSDYDFYRSEWDEANNQWGEPAVVDALNTDGQDWKIWVDENETVAYVTTKGTFDDSTTEVRNVWKSTMTADGWSTPVNIGEPINSGVNVWSIFVGPEGEIYIDGMREVALTHYELYVSVDEYSEPVVLGAPFNTKANEREMAFNENFLFISAQDREGGVGGYGLFYAERIK